MTRDKAYQLIEEVKEVFDIVRLVDPERMVQYTIDSQGELKEGEEDCYAVWERDVQCDNCVSKRGFAQQAQMTKFEFIGDEMYFVTTKYIEIEDKAYMLEMISLIQDNAFLEACGKEGLVQKLAGYDGKMYTDVLTGARSRAYFDEKRMDLDRISAIAMIDIDSLIEVNEARGTSVGDQALRQVADSIRSCIRRTDTLIRYEEDVFILAFSRITFDIFKRRLEQIRQTIEKMEIIGYPDLHLTVSIGGYFNQIMPPNVLEKVNVFLAEAKKTCNCVVVKS